MIRKLLATDDRNVALLVSRVALGTVMFPHGAQKLLGWFSGYGFVKTMQYFGRIHVPTFLGFLLIVAEFFGSLALIVGLMSRPTAFGIAASIAGALLLVHLPNGLFMNWFGTQKGEGIEYDLLMLGLAAAVMLGGAGALSADSWLSKVIPRPSEQAAPFAAR